MVFQINFVKDVPVTSKKFKFILLFFTLIGVGLLITSGFLYKNQVNFNKRSSFTVGKIYNIAQNDKGNYAPIFEYIVKGKKYLKKSKVHSSYILEKVGDKVEVLYDPDNTHNSILNCFDELWFASIITAILGVVFFFVGLFGLKYYYKHQKQPKETSLEKYDTLPE